MNLIRLSAGAIGAVAGLIGVGLIVLCLWKAYGWAYGNGYDAASDEYEQVLSGLRDDERAALEKARESEQARQAAVDAAAAEYERGKADAESIQAAVVADLRSDALRLRSHWRGCEAGRVSDSAESARLLADADQRRTEAAGRVVRVGAECDARQRAWERYAEAVRG